MAFNTNNIIAMDKDEKYVEEKLKNHRCHGNIKCCASRQSLPQDSLKHWNSFHLEVYASRVSVVDSIDTLCKYWLESHSQGEPTLLLGEGSNVLFLENFYGHVIINRIQGIKIDEQDKSWLLHVGAGENWHQLVKYTLQNGMPGLENLALIPGCAGSAPIQNIGAYGVELAKFCEYVDVVCLTNNKVRRLTSEECQFGYRDSVFKHHYLEGYAIVAVGLRLAKTWQPLLSYGDLNTLNPFTVTPQQVFDMVCEMRRKKLPDPNLIGNAGSFFKNPIVTAEQAGKLRDQFSDMPQYHQKTSEVKLAAGWLIDQCGLKGFRIGGAAVHDKQALVVVNADGATGRDVIDLAYTMRQHVGEKFAVWLEPEVRFIAAHGETDAVKALLRET